MAEQSSAPIDPATGQPMSKNALKKLQKEKEKAEKKAAAKTKQQTVVQQEPIEDPAKDNYGQLVSLSADAQGVHLKSLEDQHVGRIVVLRAWIQNVRLQSAKMAFMELREEGDWAIQGLLQVSTNSDGAENMNARVVSRQMVKWAGGLNPESFVVVEATVERPYEPIKSCKITHYELHIRKCYLIAAAPTMLGLTLAAANRPVTSFNDANEEEAKPEETGEAATQAPGASLLTHLDNIVIHKRAPVQQAIADVRGEVKELYRSYLRSHGFKEFEPPCLIGAASEGGASVFGMPYFNQKAFLAQSPQFYKQIEIAGGRKRVFSIGPVFRAENSNSTRHMTEFTGLDMEMEIQKDYHEVMLMLEGVLLHVLRGIKECCAEQIELVRSTYPGDEILRPEPGKEVRLTFAEGQQLLRSEGPEDYRNVRDDEDMSTPQEKALGVLVRKKFNTDFYILDKFPDDARPFYAKIDPASPPDGPKVTNAFDFFLCGQEILSGGQRINDPEELEDHIRAKSVDPKSAGIKEYVDVFRQAGVPPHGGGGFGLDRIVAQCLNLPSVHLAAFYPRTPRRLLP